MLNQLERLLEIFPEADWNWRELSFNPCINWRILSQFPEKPWNWDALSLNPALSWQTIREHPEKPWNYEKLLYNPSLCFSELREVLQELRPGIYYVLDQSISKNINLSWQEIRENLDLPWNWEFIAANPAICFRDCLTDGSLHIDWDFNWVSRNPQLDWQLIEEYPEFPWNFEAISEYNRNLTPEILVRWKSMLNFEFLSRNSVITEECFRVSEQEAWNLKRLLFSARDLNLIRRLVFNYQLLAPCRIPENLLRILAQNERLIYLIRACKYAIERNIPFRVWPSIHYRSLDFSLSWLQILRDPSRYNFRSLSLHQFHRFPEALRAFRNQAEKLFRLLLRLVQLSLWREEYHLAIFPIRLRLDDISLRGLANLPPRLLIST
jgi:hypothetical protein